MLNELWEPRRLNNFLSPGASTYQKLKPGSEEDFREKGVQRDGSVRLENDYFICFEMAHSFSLEYSL